VLSVVVPAYQEERRLGPTLDRLHDFLAGRGEPFEVLVVDDGSSDGTRAVAEEAAARRPAVRVLGLDRNRGKGAAVRAGALAAKGDRILVTDADLSTPIEELTKLQARLEAGADVAIGSRGLPDSDLRVRQTVLRETMGKIFNGIVRALGMLPFRDTQCGFKLFRAEVARDLFSRATVDGFAFDVEILLLAARRYRVDEVPVAWRNDAASRVSPVRDSLRMLRDVVRLRLTGRRDRGRTPGSGDRTPSA
jgi:dolichyl-phosphate beta-glucosyltransferase